MARDNFVLSEKIVLDQDFLLQDDLLTVNLAIWLGLPTDDLFSEQWHLRNTTPGLLDLNLTKVWNSEGQDYTGAGVYVAVMDDGLQRTHHDLDANYSRARDWDFRDNDTDPSPAAGDDHGTAVAGIIGANRDGEGTVGVAYNSTLFGFRVGEFINDSLVENMTDAANYASGVGGGGNYQADVMNMSYGTMYSGNWFDSALDSGLMDDLNDAFDDGAAQGRGGLGTIYVKSAGNSRSIDHDANASSWNANKHTISVAAVDQDGFVSSYSTHGANLLVSAFGSPLAGEVVTTDRTGTDGYNAVAPNEDYTFGFNGTSAAAPMVSGVVALMLEANPDLGWRDVQEILAYSARHVGSDVGNGTAGNEEYAWQFNNADDWNGGGLHFSRDYGFGLVDALAAVRLAETWGDQSETSANDAVAYQDFFSWNHAETLDGIPNFGNSWLTSGTESYHWTETTNVRIEHVTIEIDFETTNLDDFEFTLISPDGTSFQVINDIGGSNGFGVGGGDRWTFTTNAFWGEESAGDWTITLTDDAAGAETIIYDIDWRAHGAEVTSDDHYIFTNEFSDYAGTFGHSTVFNGGSGLNTLNAAAVTSSTTIDLQAGTGTIDGVSITNFNIDRVFTGDGNDTIVADGISSYLDGGRGRDTITGGSGAETIIGGSGNDVIDSGAGDDVVYGGSGNDVITPGSGDDTVYGEAGNDTITSNGGGYYDGGSGNDYMYAGLGTPETLVGGSGTDTLDTTSFSGDYTVNLATGSTNWAGESFTGFENLVSGSGDDTLTGTAGANDIKAGAGDDTVRGEGGNDVITGGAGADFLVGGDGSDVFVYNDASESSGLAVDTIDGFDGAGIQLLWPGLPKPTEDRIDLSGIDANMFLFGDQSFSFRGVQSDASGLAFGAGSLWVDDVGDHTFVKGTTDGSDIDLTIDIADGAVGASDYWSGDFVL